MPSTGALGGTLPSGLKSFKVKRQAFTHDGSTGLMRPTPASLPVQITITGLEPRVQLDVAGRSENFLVDTGATYSVLTSIFTAFSVQTCTILSATGKTITEIFTQALIYCWGGQVFPTSFWGSLGILLPCWEEIYSLSWEPPL